MTTPRARAEQRLEPIVYELRAPSPQSQTLDVVARIPTDGRSDIELMMPRWMPGEFRIVDYASRVRTTSARTPSGENLSVSRSGANRWRVTTRGSVNIVVSYTLACTERSIFANWVSRELAVVSGAPTFITLAETARRPHEVDIAWGSAWRSVATAMDQAPDGIVNHFTAASYDDLVDTTIVAGNLAENETEIAGKRHVLIDSGSIPTRWNGERATADFARIVRAIERMFGEMPYPRYFFINIFGFPFFNPYGIPTGALAHRTSSVHSPEALVTEVDASYLHWLTSIAREFFHVYNGKMIRPVELGPFDYERAPRTDAAWIMDGITEAYALVMLTRSGMATVDEFLAGVSALIGELQNTPARLSTSLGQASLDAWTQTRRTQTFLSPTTKGALVGLLLDTRIRRITGGRRSLDDVMKVAYLHYSQVRGYTTDQFRGIAEQVAGELLRDFFDRALAPGELDYTEFLEWYGLRFVVPGWSLAARPGQTGGQRARLAALVSG